MKVKYLFYKAGVGELLKRRIRWNAGYFPLKPVIPGQGEHPQKTQKQAGAPDQLGSLYFVFEIENEGANAEFPSRPVRKSSPPRTLLTRLPPARLTFITLIGGSIRLLLESFFS